MRYIITDLNDTYPEDTEMITGKLKEGDRVVRLDMRDIPGKNLYCSEDAFDHMKSMLSGHDHPESGIHFIDTGNFHYMSRIYTSFIEEAYDLILFDHHTDMQEVAFGGILSCGSWAGEVLAKDPHLRSLTIFGPENFEEGGEEAECAAGELVLKGRCYKGAVCSGSELPVYLSVDKDILDVSECMTNWDQGDLSTDELTGLLKNVINGRRVIGADICGGISQTDPGYTEKALFINSKSDIRLCRVLSDLPVNCV